MHKQKRKINKIEFRDALYKMILFLAVTGPRRMPGTKLFILFNIWCVWWALGGFDSNNIKRFFCFYLRRLLLELELDLQWP